MKILRIAAMALAAMLGLLVLGVAVLYLVFDGDKLKSEISRTVLEQKQRTLVIAGQPKLSVWPDVGVQLEGVTLSEHSSTSPFASVEFVRVSVALMPLLSHRIQVRTLDVKGLSATLIKHKDGTLNIADLLGQSAPPTSNTSPTAPQPEVAAQPLSLDVAAIHVSNAQLTWRDEATGKTTQLSNLNVSTGRLQADSGAKTASVDALAIALAGQSGTDAFELKLDVPKLSLSPEKSVGDSVLLSASLQGPQHKASVNLALSGVEGNAQALKIGNLVVKLDAKAGDATLQGQLNSPVTVNLDAQSVALAQLGGSLTLVHPAMPMKQLTLPIRGALKVNGKQETAALDLSTQFDDTKLVAQINVNKFAPLALAFDVDLDALNVDKYLPPAPPASSTAAPKATPEAPLDLSALIGPNVTGKLRIGALQVANLKIAQLQARLVLVGGKLEVAPLSMNLYEGSANGSLSVNAKGNAVAMKQTLSGISINPLMKDAVNKDLLEGKGTVVLDINTHGDTVGAMKKALAGSASLALKDGAVKGINLAQTLRDLKAKLGQADTTQAANANQKTDFSEMSASFKIANGVAHNDDLSMKSPFIRLSGAGDIDVGAGSINYLAKAAVVGSEEGQGGKAADQLKGLTVPVLLSGPFDGLSYKIQWGAMLEDATKAKVEEKKQELKTKAEEAVRDKAKDLLKGLLGK